MTGEQSAEHLARLKRAYPLWSIRRITEGFGFAAQRAGRPGVWAATLPDLEARLHDASAAAARAAALLAAHGGSWDITIESGAWIAVRKSPDGRHVEVHAGMTPGELAGKLAAAGNLEPAA
jgi:hypothetical protein